MISSIFSNCCYPPTKAPPQMRLADLWGRFGVAYWPTLHNRGTACLLSCSWRIDRDDCMKTEKKAEKSFMLKVAHEMAKGLYDAGIMDATTMREFDALCLPPVKRLSSEQIKKIRLRIRLSKSVFAKYLNTTSSTVKKWEQGDKSPRALLSSCSILSQKRP